MVGGATAAGGGTGEFPYVLPAPNEPGSVSSLFFVSFSLADVKEACVQLVTDSAAFKKFTKQIFNGHAICHMSGRANVGVLREHACCLPGGMHC